MTFAKLFQARRRPLDRCVTSATRIVGISALPAVFFLLSTNSLVDSRL
jgi:hypothetical protein